MPIRTRLLLLVLAILLPAFLAAALGIGYVYSEAQTTNRKTLQETTRALALLLDSDIETREAILLSLADSPALDRGDLATFYHHAQKTAAGREATIVLADAEGHVLLNTAVPFGAMEIANSGTLLELRKKHGPDGTIVSDLYLSPHRKTQSFAVQVPVKRNGRVVYYVSMGSNAKQIQSVLTSQRLPKNWMGAIIDGKGLHVARTTDPEKYVGRRAPDALIATIRANREGFFENITMDNVHTLASFSHAPRSEWAFVINVPRSELRRTALQATVFMISVSLLLLGFALAAAFAVARKTVQPLEALRLSAERLGKGEIVLPVDSGNKEMDEVRAAMAKASTDISSGKAELERRVEQAVAAAGQSQRALLQAQKLDALGRLTGGIAHDFNNVLQTLTGGLQLAHYSSQDARIKSLIETCQRAVDRAVELTRQLMAFGRVQDARLETVDLPRQIRETTPLLKGSLPSNIDFQLILAERLWPVTVDRLQFELALLNLTINARDAMRQGGILRIEARNEAVNGSTDELEPGDYVRVIVSDTGEGMTPEVLAKALDPFFTTKDIGKGSGMGLPQVYGFAKQAAGTLIIRSQTGKGTQAILYLPKAERPLLKPESETGNPPQQDMAPGKVLLFVEDDPLVRDVVRPALEELGFLVLQAADAAEAVEILESRTHVDFVFSDIVMPGKISGIDLAELVQKRYPRIGVVLATGYSDRRVALPNIRTLAKPYKVSDVVNALTRT
ncbi:MAG: putative histidine kinase, hybrid [Herminiimonas sp.]|nr:putative histidine kinase, hybrid [Herminiimonas sp.]